MNDRLWAAWVAGLALRSRVSNDCACQALTKTGSQGSLEVFSQIRKGCPALSQLLLRDDAWTAVRAQALSQPDLVGHRSYLLLALEGRLLTRLTQPIHRLLLEGPTLRSGLTAQYKNDLEERWVLKKDEPSKHKAFRDFFGKVVEIQVADWLARHGWNISNLEAFGAPSDIQASRGFGRQHSFEVKYLGRSDNEFALILSNINAGKPVADTLPVYTPPNYLLFRTYEAAKRLAGLPHPRVALIVVDDQTWHNFDLPLRNHWIQWEAPVFLGHEAPWAKFLSSQLQRYPDVETKLGEVVSSLDEIWIMRLRANYVYEIYRRIYLH